MLPVLEDTRLAQRWSEGRISIDALLSYSAVCDGTVSVPLPGDISAEQLSLIIGDMPAWLSSGTNRFPPGCSLFLAKAGRDDRVPTIRSL